MDETDLEKQKALARRIAASTSDANKEVLRRWIEELLAVKDSQQLGRLEKAKKAISLTANSAVIGATAKTIADAITPEEVIRLTRQLLEIKNSDLSKAAKVTRSTALVVKSLKVLAWDNRRMPTRLAIAGAVVGAVVFGGQGAGIAALGTAIGVPLWVVFGAGAAFLGVLYDELTPREPPPETTYRVIEARRSNDG